MRKNDGEIETGKRAGAGREREGVRVRGCEMERDERTEGEEGGERERKREGRERDL